MANIQKYQQHGLGHLFKHFERAKDETGQYIKFGNQDIDPERTPLNYNLAPDRESQYGFVMERIKQVHCLKRKDVNLMCSCILTAPKDLPEREHEAFFKAGYEHLCQRYGADNVISAYVHMDERTPHMHFAWVPICYDKKKDRLTVSAKSVVTRQDLLKLHPELERHISRALGHDVHVMTGELSNRPDLTLTQYKTMKKIEAQLERVMAKLEGASKTFKELEPVLLKIEEINKIQPRETMTGALRDITLDDVERLKNASRQAAVLEHDLSKIRKEYTKLENAFPTIEEQDEQFRRDERLRRLEAAIPKMPPEFQKALESALSIGEGEKCVKNERSERPIFDD